MLGSWHQAAIVFCTLPLALAGAAVHAQGIEQVFKPDQLKATYCSAEDALINRDPRMKTALCSNTSEIRKTGFEYNRPDEGTYAAPARRRALNRLTPFRTCDPLPAMTRGFLALFAQESKEELL